MDRHARRLTFDRDPDRYQRVRPVFPDRLFDALFERLPPHPRMVEVGPGTGQATQALLERGAEVTAVEIGPRLASYVRARFSSDALTVVNAAFERADLPPAAWDAVFSANAYHWIDEQHRIARPAALLVGGGIFATMDFIQYESPTDRGLFDRIKPIFDSFGVGPPEPELPEFSEARPIVLPELQSSSEFTNTETIRLRADMTLSVPELRDLLNTNSNVQALPREPRMSLIRHVLNVVEAEFGGEVTVPTAAVLVTADRR